MFEYSIAELIVLPCMIAAIALICTVLGLLLKNKPDNIRAIPLQVIAGIIIVLEIIKQIIAIVNGYSAWTIPLHFCSLFVFFIPLAQFTKGRFQQTMKPVAFTAAMALVLLFYINPTSVIGSSCADVFGSFSDFHTFTFHHLAILYLPLSIVLKNYKPSKKDFLSVLLVMGVYFVVAMPLAHILDANYCNFLTSNIPFMEQLRLAAGQWVYSFAMLLVIVGGTSLLCFGYYWLIFWIDKLRQKKAGKVK